MLGCQVVCMAFTSQGVGAFWDPEWQISQSSHIPFLMWGLTRGFATKLCPWKWGICRFWRCKMANFKVATYPCFCCEGLPEAFAARLCPRRWGIWWVLESQILKSPHIPVVVRGCYTDLCITALSRFRDAYLQSLLVMETGVGADCLCDSCLVSLFCWFCHQHYYYLQLSLLCWLWHHHFFLQWLESVV